MRTRASSSTTKTLDNMISLLLRERES
ncbi:hypothetical protein FHT02_003395 [Sphingomonas xinjiangensis]|uniref:Uncharacterized protein n=1 Tax=Sphingomonas xinjiangensis TaxID=643568 RepID=A0A840YLD4_9SPHN|nr:hypothetical protein [Sphingomonas xinjiangensis]